MGATMLTTASILALSCAVGTLAAPITLVSTSVKLNNGVDMPIVAFGANVWDAPVCNNATALALKAGFRFIWSSTLIGADCQSAQADAIASSGLKREDIFLAGTVNTQDCSSGESCYSTTLSDAQAQFTTLKSSTLDMLMLDYPSSGDCDSIAGQWRAFEELYAAKKVRTIAVSNFSPEQFACILSNTSAVVPSVNQMQYSVGEQVAPSAAALYAKHGIVLQAYSPLGSGSLASDPLLQKIG